MTKPVHDYRKDGLRFRLYTDGNIAVSSKDLPERSLHQLDRFSGTTSKGFSTLCRAMIQEGFLDGMLAEQARISRERGAKRNAGIELYDALSAMLRLHELSDSPDGDVTTMARAALAKARGES